MFTVALGAKRIVTNENIRGLYVTSSQYLYWILVSEINNYHVVHGFLIDTLRSDAVGASLLGKQNRLSSTVRKCRKHVIRFSSTPQTFSSALQQTFPATADPS